MLRLVLTFGPLSSLGFCDGLQFLTRLIAITLHHVYWQRANIANPKHDNQFRFRPPTRQYMVCERTLRENSVAPLPYASDFEAIHVDAVMHTNVLFPVGFGVFLRRHVINSPLELR